MSLYREKVLNIDTNAGGTRHFVGKGVIRIVSVDYTEREISAVSSTVRPFNTLYNNQNGHFDFDNWGGTSPIPLLNGDPRNSTYHSDFLKFCPYASYISDVNADSAPTIYFYDDDGNGFSYVLYTSASLIITINGDTYSSGSLIFNSGMSNRGNGYLIGGSFVLSNDGYLFCAAVVQQNATGASVSKNKFTAADTAAILNWIDSLPDPLPPQTDPYEPGGYSGTGGGGGGQNFASDAIGFAPLPTLSFADTGFCKIYNPTLTQLRDLASYMWTDTTFWQTVVNHAKQLLENPMEAIISLSMVPVKPETYPTQNVTVLFISTGVGMNPVKNQFVEVDCGTLSLPVADQYGAALDFNPYTSIDLYLPYIGQVTIDIDEVMYKTMHCVYRVDVVTGMCVACISVLEGTDGVAGETVLYQFAGHCGVQMPLTSADFSGYVGAVISATKMVAGIAAAGAGAPGVAAGLIGAPSPQTSRTSSVTTESGGGATWSNYATTRNPKTGRQITAATSGGESSVKPRVTTRDTTHTSDPPSFGELAMRGAVNTVDGVMGGKMHVEHSGGFTGTSGYIAGVRRPYAIIKHPNQCYPENYASYRGFPAMIYMSLDDCEGYTEVHDIQINGMSATNPELGELVELLKTGVIF